MKEEMELLEYIKDMDWSLSIEGDFFPQINHMCLRIYVATKNGKTIERYEGGYTASLYGYSYGDFDIALDVLAKRMSGFQLVTVDRIREAGSNTIETENLAVAPVLIHTKKMTEWLDTT